MKEKTFLIRKLHSFIASFVQTKVKWSSFENLHKILSNTHKLKIKIKTNRIIKEDNYEQ